MSDILDKIKKVLAKAEGTDNPAEAEVFMNKVQSLLDEHNLTMSKVQHHRLDDPVQVTHFAATSYKASNWTNDLVGFLARMYNCDAVIGTVGNHIYYHVVGRQSAAAAFKLMFPYLVSSVRRQAKAMVEEHRAKYPELYKYKPKQIPDKALRKQLADLQVTSSKAERQIGRALGLRIGAMNYDRERTLDGDTRNALVPVSELESVKLEAFPDIGEAKEADWTVTPEAMRRAKEIGLEDQVGGTTNETLQIEKG